MVRAKGVPLNLDFLREYGVKPGMILSLIWNWQQKSDDGFRRNKLNLIKLGMIEEKKVGRNQRAYKIRK